MSKISLSFLLVNIIFIYTVRAQTKVIFKLEDQQNKAIPYASIRIIPGNSGTITNANGFFEIKFSNQEGFDQIQISCIGYKSKLLSIDSLLKRNKNNQVISITLNKQSYQLQEVIIRKQEVLKNAKQIVVNAINELPNLLDTAAHIGKYYFKQSHKLDTSISRLIEAAVSIYDPGIHKNINECKFNIDQLQSSLDNRKADYKSILRSYLISRKKKWHLGDPRIKTNSSYKDTLIQRYLIEDLDHSKASFSKFFTSTNMIRSIEKGRRKKSLRINPFFTNGRPIITDSFTKEHLFKLDCILMYNNEAVYKIKILPNKRYPKIKYMQDSKIPIGFMYVRIKDFAFLYLDYGYINNPNYKYSKGRLKHYFRFKVKYEQFNKHLYLCYLFSDRFDYTSDLTRRRRVIQELSLSKIINNQDIISKQVNTLNWKGDIYEKLPYNQEFWNNYSTMLPTDEEQLLKINLIKEIQKKKK
ncbi:carboxypeptidase-like regulatory domain-containing protein [Marinifilum fragile]|uniref:carboxypeptidase-like regulatory domain-containing protein n=1 Tax=Marinifilum fragile TaxID=570161 RepID=UPI002AA7E8CE|nr:carboxypeptidase-like regulatory domain-containing protein [Marinifilum fragile]